MGVRITVTDVEDRKVSIATQRAVATGTEPVLFKGRPEPLPVVRLPIDLLVYRMENGRTKLKQEEYIQRNDKKPDFFLTGEENEEVQTTQHGFLVELAQDPRADLFKELTHTPVQTERLLITHTGVVVNGNRRLATMRELLDKPDTKFTSFGSVDVVVLPETALPSDIEEIEADLQEKPETKLEYDWISRRLKLRHRRDELKIKPEELRRWYRFRTVKDINREVGQLELAEDYLERYLKRPKQYDLILDGEEIFKRLQAALESKDGELEEMSRCIAYPLIKERRNLDTRVYDFRKAFAGDAEQVLERLAAERSLPLGAAESTELDSDDDDPLAGVTEDSGGRFTSLSSVLLDDSSSGDIARSLAMIASQIEQEREEKGRKDLALRKASGANTLVHEIELDGADPATFPAVKAQLESCISRAQELCDKLGKNGTDSKAMEA